MIVLASTAGMDFERKAELEGLLAKQEPEMQEAVLDSEAAPQLAQEEPLGPVPAKAPEEKPDESALSAWMDDLDDFEREHAGDSESVEAVDKLKSAMLDDLAAGERERMFGDVGANEEQHGMVADFHADLALEGSALAVPEPNDPYMFSAATRPNPWTEEYGDGDGAPPPPADEDDKKKQAAATKPEPAKSKPADKNRDGNR